MREIKYIIIHCSATRVDRDITAAHIHAAHIVQGYSSAGYHYYIRKNGKIETMRPLEEPGHMQGDITDIQSECAMKEDWI